MWSVAIFLPIAVTRTRSRCQQNSAYSIQLVYAEAFSADPAMMHLCESGTVASTTCSNAVKLNFAQDGILRPAHKPIFGRDRDAEEPNSEPGGRALPRLCHRG